MQKSFFRNAVAMVFAAVILTKNHGWHIPEKKNLGFLVIRSVAGTVGVLCNFYAVSNMNLADASTLNKLSPFFAVIFSALVLKERPRFGQLAAVCAAFVGAMLVMKPTFSADALPSFLGFLGGMGAGLAYTYVRRLSQNGEKGAFIVFFFSVFSCLVCLPSLIFSYAPMSIMQTVCLLLAGLFAGGGQMFITAAYAKAPAKEISVYDYSQIIFTTLLSYIVFGDLPDMLSFLGYAVIIAAAVYNSRTNKVKE